MKIKKLISLILSLCFLNLIASDIYCVMPLNIPISSTNITQIENNFIPMDLGKVTEDIYIGGKQTIVNIQDLHADYSAQKNIASIIEYLVNNYNVKNIYLEGAVKKLDFNWIRMIKDSKLRAKVAEKLVEDGKLTGAEFFGIFNENSNIKFHGLEDEKIYKENFELLGWMYENRISIESKVNNILKNLSIAKHSTYNYVTKQIDEIIYENKEGYLSQKQYYSYLIKLANKLNLEVAQYATMLKYIEFEKNISKLNTQNIKNIFDSINKDLSSKLSYDKYKQLIQLYKKYPLEYYKTVKQLLAEDIANGKYVQLKNFYNCIEQKNEIDTVLLINEEDLLLQELYNNASKTIVEKNLIFLNEYTAKLLLFFTNKITSFDYNYINSNFNRYVILLENYISNADIVNIKQIYAKVNKFYSNNELRNKLFLENMFSKKITNKDFVNDAVIKNQYRKPFKEIIKETNQAIDIVVTGGYHSNGLKSLMASLDINYAVVMPKVESYDINESAYKFYQDYSKQYSVLSNTYQKFIRSSLMNEQWGDPLKVTVVNFLDYSLIKELFENIADKTMAQEIVSDIQKYVLNIFKEKGLSVDAEILTIETVENNAYLITVQTNNTKRLFYVASNITKEINNKQEIENIENNNDSQNISKTEQTKPSSFKRFIKRLSRFMKMVLILPFMMTMGGGMSFGGTSPKTKSKSANDNVVDESSNYSVEGNVILDNVIVGASNIFKMKAGINTVINVKNIDMNEIGELDIQIDADGEFDVVVEDGFIKIYKVLRTDVSSLNKKRIELISVFKQGKLYLPAEKNWDKDNRDPVIIFYKGGFLGDDDLVRVKEQIGPLYKDNNVIYVNISDISGWTQDLWLSNLKKVLKEKGVEDKCNIRIDSSLVDSYSKEKFNNILLGLDNMLDTYTGITFLKTEVKSDGTVSRYPYKDATWLRSVLSKYLPAFNKRTYMFIWPVESVKLTYSNEPRYDTNFSNAYEQFNSFFETAKKYAASNKDAIIFIPEYLFQFLPQKTVEKVVYGNSDEVNTYQVQYKRLQAKDVQQIKLCKIDGVSVVVYPEGNRGHNEQAYLKTLMATYNYGKESLDTMLTQAGFNWKENTTYVYQGQEMDTVDMENELLKNPSVKKGSVTYVFDNLKRVFIDLYSNMKKIFSSTIFKYTKGNWINVETNVRTSLDIEKIKDSLTAKSKLGFDSVSVIPVKEALLDEISGTPEILEYKGVRIPVYSVKDDNGVVYFVGVSSNNINWQQIVLSYIKSSLKDYHGNIISFDGLPQISTEKLYMVLDKTYNPVILNQNHSNEQDLSDLGYDIVVEPEDISARVDGKDLKYPFVAADMHELTETIKIIKALKKKSFLGQFDKYKTSFVGVKIASDEHIFNSEIEENEFMNILNGSDIDFVSVVIRNNDLDVHVLGRETTVKENLTRLLENLHKNNKKMILEYTFRLIDDHFTTFVRSIKENFEELGGVDGLKIDLSDCSVDDVKKIMQNSTIDDELDYNLVYIRQNMPNLEISIQVSDEVWNEFRDSFEELSIKRTVSSKDEVLMGNNDLSSTQDINYEISIYKNQEEYKQRRFTIESRLDINEIKNKVMYMGIESLSSAELFVYQNGIDAYLDQIIDSKLTTILKNVIATPSIGKLTLPVNMLYAQRLKNNENSNVIQAVSNLTRLFKEAKGLAERKKFAYEYGLKQNIILTPQQEEEIAQILRGESNIPSARYVRNNFPYVFDYFVESRKTRIEVGDGFLFGIYESNAVRKFKEGQYGNVFEFRKTSAYQDTEEKAFERQKIFNRLLAQIILYKDKCNVKNLFQLQEDEFVFYEESRNIDKDLNKVIESLKDGRIYSGTTFFKNAFPYLNKIALGYMTNREDTIYAARLLMTMLCEGYQTTNIEPILPIIVTDQLLVDDVMTKENTSDLIKSMLASA